MNTKPFELIMHSKDAAGAPIVYLDGKVYSNTDARKLRDELNRLMPEAEHIALAHVASAAYVRHFTTDSRQHHDLDVKLGQALAKLGEVRTEKRQAGALQTDDPIPVAAQ